MVQLELQGIRGERLARQRLLYPIEKETCEQEYIELFRLLQPVSPVHFSRPGDPPRLVHRTSFNDFALAGRLRERNRMVKGRFCGGRIGYVLEEDLGIYATAFCKSVRKHKPIYDVILQLLRQSGGLTKDQLKEELPDCPASELNKALQTLQEAFLVYEHQPDTSWETGWFEFATEWFPVESDPFAKHKALLQVIHRFIRAMVFATATHIRSWSQLPANTIQLVLQDLLEEGTIIPATVDRMGTGYICAEDMGLAITTTCPPCTFMLDKADFLVRAHLNELKERFGGHEVLQYLLIDGTFQGAVVGHWRIGPYELDDVVLDLPAEQAAERREEIINAITCIYSPATHPLRRYNGVPV